MKRKVLVVLLIGILMIGMVILTGCGNLNKENGSESSTSSKLDKEEVVNNLHFKYSSEATLKDSTNGKRVEYENYTIIVSHQKDKTGKEIAESRNMNSLGSVDYNKTEWNKYEYKDQQVSTITFMCDKDGGCYLVTITHDVNKTIDLDKDIEEFMNNVKF